MSLLLFIAGAVPDPEPPEPEAPAARGGGGRKRRRLKVIRHPWRPASDAGKAKAARPEDIKPEVELPSPLRTATPDQIAAFVTSALRRVSTDPRSQAPLFTAEQRGLWARARADWEARRKAASEAAMRELEQQEEEEAAAILAVLLLL